MIHVLSPGFLTTIQDLGRPGFAHWGVSASGVSDSFSFRIGNLLVGNQENSPALEMTLVGAEFEFESTRIFSITGSDFTPLLDQHPAPLWTALKAEAGQRLKLGATTQGARCYLCIGGGIDAPTVLGSASTHLTTGLGGLGGRALMKGDRVPLKRTQEPAYRLVSLEKERVGPFQSRSTLRITKGPQADLFEKSALETLALSSYTVSEESDRMGLRLNGPRLTHRNSAEILTEGIPLGAIQVPQNGMPLISFVEHQTTGGYAKIANVISADIHRVGQLRPRDRVGFEYVSFKKALLLLREQEQFIQSLKRRIHR